MLIRCLLLFALTATAVHAQPLDDRGVENIAAFVRVAGIVRYFHASDAAVSVDWDEFTAANVTAVERAETPQDLAAKLTALFRPIAPSIQLRASTGSTSVESVNRLQLVQRVKWLRHRGVKTNPDNPSEITESRRITSFRLTRSGTIAGLLVSLLAGVSSLLSTRRRQLMLSSIVLFLVTIVWSVGSRTIPDPNDRFTADLPGQVRLTIPLAVASDAPAFRPPSGLAPSPRSQRLATVSIGWNVLQHFYPYPLDDRYWLDTLRLTLRKAAVDRTDRELLDTLRAMTARLGDSHAVVKHRSDRDHFTLPIRWEWVEGQLIITEVAVDYPTKIKRGDAVTHVDGVAVPLAIEERGKLVAASTTASKRWWAIRRLARGEEGTTANLSIAPIAGQPFSESMKRGVYRFPPRRAKVRRLGNGILELDLTQLSAGEFNAALPEMQKARGIVFHLETYPFGFPDPLMLEHLVSRPFVFGRFERPIATKPDRHFDGWHKEQRRRKPKKPRIEAKVVWITSPAAVSYAEHCLDAVQHYELGTVMGETTSGAFGDANEIRLPGNYVMMWTASRAVRLDGRPLHGVGIVPNVTVRPTRAGVTAGRDEVVEKALEILGN